jgi:predicted nucleic acid-binding Zn ribbon protein
MFMRFRLTKFPLQFIFRSQPGFKQCMMCVHWFDRNDDQPEVDDGFYYERKTNSPLCSVPWANREICDTKCQHIRVEKQQRQRWSTSDHILLAILVTFGLIMVGLIIRKRNQMSNKDTLLEQAALSASGLQQPHVIGLFILVVIVIAVFGLLGLKNVTWTLLLTIDTILFAYLMKLTISSSINSPETIIGPDGTIFRTDSDDSSVGSNGQQTNTTGTYNLPVID